MNRKLNLTRGRAKLHKKATTTIIITVVEQSRRTAAT